MQLLVISLVCIIGVTQTFRPGLPTISRMLADDTGLLPYIYMGFVVLLYQLRTITLLEWGTTQNSIRLSLEFIQAISFLYVYVASVDYSPVVHSIVASCVVGSTLGISLTYYDYREPCSMISVLHAIAMIQFIVLAIVTMSILFTVADVERNTYFALTEYALFKTVPVLMVFAVLGIRVPPLSQSSSKIPPA